MGATDKGTKGGVAVMIKSHIQGRVEMSHLEEGCGFEAVDVRLQHTNLLVVSVYLKTGTSIHARPNSSILAELLSLVKNWKGVWIIAGDFNTPPEEIAATNLLAEMNGCLCRVGVPTTDQGREIDYAIVHKALESLCQIRLDWAVPHKPHASLSLKLDLGEGLCPAMMLEPRSQNIEAGQVAQGSDFYKDIQMPLDQPIQGEWLRDKLPQDASTQHFAAVSQACSECVEPTCPSERGTSLKIVRRPLLQPTAPQTKRTAKCSWARALTWLKAAKKGESSRRNWQTVVEWIHNLPAVKGAEDPESIKFQLAEFLATGTGDSQPLTDQVERYARLAKADDYEEDKAQYQAWLEEAQAGSMRPLFRTVKSHEVTTVRPFGHVEPGLRPFLRFIQWQEIWGAVDSAIERVMPQSQLKATAEAKELKALTGSKYGLDWTTHHRLLKRHAKRHTICTGLRMAWQGAVLCKDHGGPDNCPRCGQPNMLRHAILGCPAWDSFDMGADKSWVESLPKQEDCFVLRGLVPRHWTHHPPLTAKQLQPVATGLLVESNPDVTGLYVATDASG